MIRNVRKNAILIFVFLYQMFGVAFADNQMWIVPEKNALCLIEHKTAYLASSKEIVIIRIDKCPTTSNFSGAFDKIENYGGVSNIPTKEEDGDFDAIISFTTRKLACLKLEEISFNDGKAYIPKYPKCND